MVQWIPLIPWPGACSLARANPPILCVVWGDLCLSLALPKRQPPILISDCTEYSAQSLNRDIFDHDWRNLHETIIRVASCRGPFLLQKYNGMAPLFFFFVFFFWKCRSINRMGYVLCLLSIQVAQ